MVQGRGGTVYVIGPAHRGLRLDRFLHDRIPRLSRRQVQRAIAERVAIDRVAAPKPSTRLQAGDRVTVAFPPVSEDPEALERIEIPVLYEDGELLAVDKPAGLVVHPTHRVHRASVIVHLRERHPEGRSLTLVHRLDRGTTGVLLLAKGSATARRIHGWFVEGLMRKRYLAVVAPPLPEEHGAAGTWDAPIGPDPSPSVRFKRRVDPAGYPARTDYRLLESLPGCSLLELRPRTGRQHQIRVHLQAAGHPVVGDSLYGLDGGAPGEPWRAAPPEAPPRHLLHAAALTLPPAAGGRVIEAPVPADMKGFLEAARGSVGAE